MHEFERSKIWSEAFAERSDDPEAQHRARLKNAFLMMRANVEKLLMFIPADCKGLTVHDISYIDALWETADLITSGEVLFNPAETFVLGCAFLLHDAGLSSAAFPGGLAEIQETDAWRSAVLDAVGVEWSPSLQLDEEDKNSIKFKVLRELHASQAEKLATQSWNLGGSQIFLLDDTELREALGESIGLIAHSHHWDIAQLAGSLQSHRGASVVLPGAWTVNEKKIACLLRCADAAQVDRVRAPALLYAVQDPKGISKMHWQAQFRLNKPVLVDRGVQFSSSRAFPAGQAEAWWVVYDLACILDRELKSSNSLLAEQGLPSFSARHVVGAETPVSFATHVRTERWKPIDASVRVSDPLRLAKTLGGRHLYGRDWTVPIRELLQNAADAVRARRVLEGRSQAWGVINIVLERADEGWVWLHVDDNGIGMSERVLAGPLVDFGRSVWGSSLIADEFPGLKGKKLSPIGKFGIGFFSVFELAKTVRVVSRRCTDSDADIRALEFASLLTRPLIREASRDELPLDVSTRVSMKIPLNEAIEDGLGDMEEAYPHYLYSPRAHGYRRPRPARTFAQAMESLRSVVSGMVAYLDMAVSLTNTVMHDNLLHRPDFDETMHRKFLEELYEESWKTPDDLEKDEIAKRIRPLHNERGELSGLAALEVRDEDSPRRSETQGMLAVGRLVTQRAFGHVLPYIGVLAAETDRAARDVAQVVVDEASLKAWAGDQAGLIDQSFYAKPRLMRLAARLTSAGADSGPLPFCYCQGGSRTVSEFESLTGALRKLLILVRFRYETRVELLPYSDLTIEHLEVEMAPSVVVLATNETLIDNEDARDLKRNGTMQLSSYRPSSTSLHTMLQLLSRHWGGEPNLEIRQEIVFNTKVEEYKKPRWVLSVTSPE